MVKDHLGNVRMVLTDDQQIDHYPTATLEANAVTAEKTYYDINTSNVVNKPTPLATEPSNLLDYVNDNGTNNPLTYGNPTAVSQKMMQLSAPNAKTGMGMVLKVMAGDKLDILAKSYYQYLGTNASNSPFNAGDIITAFLNTGGSSNAAVLHGGTYTTLNSNSSGTVTPLNNLVNNSSNTNNYNNVKAGVCYILFDEQFNLVSCQFDPVYIDAGGHGNPGSPKGGLKNHFMQGINVPKNGYLYVYCSNESNINVFFDNLEVVHTRGQILEETHYYPFGLTMSGISSKAAGMVENKYKFTGKELQSKEFNDATGFEMYDFGARNYDQQIGRWHSLDPMADKYQNFTPYNYVANNPIKYLDPDGKIIRDKDGNIVVTTTGKQVTIPVTPAGPPTKNPNGTQSVSVIDRTYDVVTIFADNGTPIEAFRLVSANQTDAVYDQSGQLISATTASIDPTKNDCVADCHGFTFAGNKLWINDDQVEKILNNDNYKRNVNENDADIAIFKKNGNVVHSGRKNSNGTYDNNAGIGVTEYNKTLKEASRALTDVTDPQNIEFDKKKSADWTLDINLGTVDKTTGIRTITDPTEIKKLFAGIAIAQYFGL